MTMILLFAILIHLHFSFKLLKHVSRVFRSDLGFLFENAFLSVNVTSLSKSELE